MNIASNALVGVFCVVGAVFLIKKMGGALPRLILYAILCASTALMNTGVGHMLQDLANKGNSLLSNLVAQGIGVGVPFLLAVLASLWWGASFYHRQVDKWSIAASIYVPIGAHLIPGMFGSLVTGLLTVTTGWAGWAVGAAFGGHGG